MTMQQDVTDADIGRGVERFVLRSWRNVDFERGVGAELFYLPDGVFVVPARTMRGRDEIAAGHAARVSGAPRLSRHVVSNLLVEPAGDGLTVAHYVVTVNAGNGAAPLTFPGPQAVCDVRDDLALGDDGWSIARRDLRAIFISPDNDSVLFRSPT